MSTIYPVVFMAAIDDNTLSFMLIIVDYFMLFICIRAGVIVSCFS